MLEQIVGKRVMRRGSTKVNGNRESLQEIFHGAAEIDFGDMSLQAFVDSDNALESLSLAVDTPITYSIEQCMSVSSGLCALKLMFRGCRR